VAQSSAKEAKVEGKAKLPEERGLVEVDDPHARFAVRYGANLFKGACYVCFEQSSLLELPCDKTHSMCYKCLVDFFRHALRDRSLLPPRCCQIELDPQLAECLLGRAEELEKFWRMYNESVATRKLFCPAPCGAMIVLDSLPEDEAEVVCPDCRASVCTSCSRVAHRGEACAQDVELQSLIENENWRRCNKCNHVVQLSSGCNHMQCLCRHQFCYVCGATWKTCHCPQFSNEEQVYETARERVAAGAPQRVVEDMANRLRNYHCVEHDYQFNHGGGMTCAHCNWDMPVFYFQCTGCHETLCRLCRNNRP
jgi:hypothetical protein